MEKLSKKKKKNLIEERIEKSPYSKGQKSRDTRVTLRNKARFFLVTPLFSILLLNYYINLVLPSITVKWFTCCVKTYTAWHTSQQPSMSFYLLAQASTINNSGLELIIWITKQKTKNQKSMTYFSYMFNCYFHVFLLKSRFLDHKGQ